MSYYYYGYPMEANKLELHYFLTDDSHLIDSFVRHKCEAEILHIAKDLITAFGGDIDILSEAPKEGGFVDFWKFVKKYKVEIGLTTPVIVLIVQILTLCMSRVPAVHPDQLKNIQLDNQLKELNIEKLKQELSKGKDVVITDTMVNECVEYLDTNYKTVKHKSNFYQTLQNYNDVTKISTTSYLDDKVVKEATVVEKADFHKFILTTNDLPTITVENAVIEVISPVLKNQKYKWKGVYNGRPISFSMKDIDYTNSVIKGDTTFHSGFFIECVLQIGRKINDMGIIEESDFSIITVLGKIEDNKVIETEQGKKYHRMRKDLDNQTSLEL